MEERQHTINTQGQISDSRLILPNVLWHHTAVWVVWAFWPTQHIFRKLPKCESWTSATEVPPFSHLLSARLSCSLFLVDTQSLQPSSDVWGVAIFDFRMQPVWRNKRWRDWVLTKVRRSNEFTHEKQHVLQFSFSVNSGLADSGRRWTPSLRAFGCPSSEPFSARPLCIYFHVFVILLSSSHMVFSGWRRIKSGPLFPGAIRRSLYKSETMSGINHFVQVRVRQNLRIRNWILFKSCVGIWFELAMPHKMTRRGICRNSQT